MEISISAPKVTPALAQVNWNSSAIEVYNLYRALYSMKPLTTTWNSLQVKLIEIKISSDAVSTEPPGTIEYFKIERYLKVICGNGRSICVHRLGLEGKKVMTAAEFYNGFLGKTKGKNFFT